LKLNRCALFQGAGLRFCANWKGSSVFKRLKTTVLHLRLQTAPRATLSYVHRAPLFLVVMQLEGESDCSLPCRMHGAYLHPHDCIAST
jgi:hypothetical protein